MSRIALVAPALAQSGGVGSVADFVRRTIRRRPDLDLTLISLSVSATDACSVLLRRPASWTRRPAASTGEFRGEPYTHVGAWLGDIELQRLKPRRELAALVRDCDLIQVVSGTPCWALPVLGLGKPVVLQTATLARVERQQRMSEARGAIGVWRSAMTAMVARLDDQALASVDAVLVENQRMFDHASALGARVRYGPPGIDVTEFTPLRSRTPADGYILCVARLSDPRKHLGLLLEAYALLVTRLPNAPRLVLAGMDALPEPLWARARSLGIEARIEQRLKPSRAELADLYRGAQTFVLSSAEEGFGVVIVEAMASGIPVVSTRSGGPDSIVSDGLDGYLVDCGDAAGMAARLEALATDPARNRAFGRKARETAVERFSEEVTGRAYLQVYDELLRTREAWARGGAAA